MNGMDEIDSRAPESRSSAVQQISNRRPGRIPSRPFQVSRLGPCRVHVSSAPHACACYFRLGPLWQIMTGCNDLPGVSPMTGNRDDANTGVLGDQQSETMETPAI